MGLQRETAGRGTMAVYTQVKPSIGSDTSPDQEPLADRVCYCHGPNLLSFCPFDVIGDWNTYHSDIHTIYCCEPSCDVFFVTY